MLSFESELALEDFVWENLEELLNLTPIARQYYIEGHVCDILALSPNRQLVVIELKNTEDRYIVQQLTRYYDSLSTHHPFAEEIDYTQPIRLLACAPNFHKHNLIDRKHSLLNYQFAHFEITQSGTGSFFFNLIDLDTTKVWSLVIPPKFHSFITTKFENPSESIRRSPPPPKSLRKIIEGSSSEIQARILQIRDQIFDFDHRIREVSLITSTRYGLAKGEKDIYQGKLCAEFLPSNVGICAPRLLLRLPYAKKELSRHFYKQEPAKGMAWAEVASGQQWTIPNIFFYLGKSRERYSFHYTFQGYALVYQHLTGKAKRLSSLDVLINVALEEWLEQSL